MNVLFLFLVLSMSLQTVLVSIASAKLNHYYNQDFETEVVNKRSEYYVNKRYHCCKK